MTIPRKSTCILVVSMLLGGAASGCYRTHGLADGAAPDGGRPPDAGRDGGADASAETPLPPDPHVDPGPDGRPSDDPSAGDWGDDPGLDPDEDCCVPLGPPTEVPVAPTIAGGLAIAWNGAGWGVLYADPQRSAFQLLDREGARLTALRRFSVGGASAALEYAEGRYAAVVSGGEDGAVVPSQIALLDRRGTLASGWSSLDLIGHQTDVARLAHGDGWVGASGAARGRPVEASEVGPDAQLRGRLAVDSPPSTFVRLAALESRVAAFWVSDGLMRVRVLTHAIADSDRAPVDVMRVDDFTSFVATRLRDHAVVLTAEGGPGGGQLAAYDAFEHRLAHAAPLELEDQPVIRYVHDAVGLDASNLIAACFGVSDMGVGEGRVELRLFTSEGRPAGRGVTAGVMPGDVGALPCAVATDGERVFVAWQRRNEGQVRVRGYALPR